MVVMWRLLLDLLLWDLQLIATAAAVVAVIATVIERRRRRRSTRVVVLLAHVGVPIAVVPLLMGRGVLLDALLHRRQLVVLLLVVSGDDQMMYRRFLLRLWVPRLDVEMWLRVDLLHVEKRRRIDDQRVRSGLL